jgi:hypothetical protein
MATDRMKVDITTEVLDAVNTGRHDLAAVQQARKVLEAAGCTVRLHQLEKQEIKRLRDASKKFAADADAMEAWDE